MCSCSNDTGSSTCHISNWMAVLVSLSQLHSEQSTKTWCMTHVFNNCICSFFLCMYSFGMQKALTCQQQWEESFKVITHVSNSLCIWLLCRMLKSILERTIRDWGRNDLWIPIIGDSPRKHTSLTVYCILERTFFKRKRRDSMTGHALRLQDCRIALIVTCLNVKRF